MNEIATIQPDNLTPIEIVLGIDKEGKTTARKLYSFLELADRQFSRWSKANITENKFAEIGTDFEGFDIDVEGNIVKDYKLAASFAKKLAMASHSPKGEIARSYFVKVEDKLKEIAQNQLVSREVGRIIRRELTDALKESGLNDQMHGFGYKTFTDLIYRLVLGMDARHYRAAFELDVHANVREHVTEFQRMQIGKVEKAVQAWIDLGYKYQEIKDMLSQKFLPSKAGD